MQKPFDVSVLIYAHVHGYAQTLRMALRGTGVRKTHLATNVDQVLEGFSQIDPHVAVFYVETGAKGDHGLEMLEFIRRSELSPNRQLPVVAVSQARDIGAIQAASNGGAHEYVLYPVAGDVLLKKIHAARMSTRRFIDTPEYVGPDRTAPKKAD